MLEALVERHDGAQSADGAGAELVGGGEEVVDCRGLAQFAAADVLGEEVGEDEILERELGALVGVEAVVAGRVPQATSAGISHWAETGTASQRSA